MKSIDAMTPAELDECAAREVMGWKQSAGRWITHRRGAMMFKSSWRPSRDWGQLRRCEERLIAIWLSECPIINPLGHYAVALVEMTGDQDTTDETAQAIVRLSCAERLRCLLKAWRAAKGEQK